MPTLLPMQRRRADARLSQKRRSRGSICCSAWSRSSVMSLKRLPLLIRTSGVPPLQGRYLRQILESNIPVLNLHRWSQVHLESYETFHFPVGRVIVNHHAHNTAIQDLDQNVAARDDVQIVPVVPFYESL